MVAFTSSLGRYTVLLSVVGSGKSNYVIADGSSLMEPSSAAWTDVHRQLVQCCVEIGTSACHPNDACNSNQRDCEFAGGQLKCNRSGNYQWGDPGSPPPPPTSSPTPKPTPLPVDPTPPPSSPPVLAPTPPPSSPPISAPTPPPSSPPVSASCGLCTEDNSISCNTDSDCPLVPSPGTCSAPTTQPTNGSTCSSDDQCLPNNGKPETLGTCNSSGLVNSECDPNLCPPTQAPTSVLDEPDPNKLIWSDEFNVDGAPDPSKWSYDIGDGCDIDLCGWGNNELQYYTSDNAVVANGMLRITAKKDSFRAKRYSSARMVTRGNQAFRYGRIQFRARTAGCTARGTWAALWLLPEEWVYGGWPDSGEIDVMEFVGHEENKYHGSVHTGAYNHGIGTQKTASVNKSELDWYTFEIDWQEDKISFAINREVFFTFAPDDVTDSAKWPFNQDFHLIMNIAVGGTWGGLDGVDAAAFEGDGQFMELDWVRVYSS